MDGQCPTAVLGLTEIDPRPERPLQAGDERLAHGEVTVALRCGGWRRSVVARWLPGGPVAHQLLRLTDAEAALQHPLERGDLLRGGWQPEEGAGMSLADLARGKGALHPVRQGEEAQGVGDAD